MSAATDDTVIDPGTCPSATGEALDASIIGAIGPSGEVAAIVPPIPLRGAVRAALGARPEAAFRLAGRCSQGSCHNWDGAACGLIDRLRPEIMADPRLAEVSDRLPACGIRKNCVWWRQSGLEACQVCRYVTYNPAS